MPTTAENGTTSPMQIDPNAGTPKRPSSPGRRGGMKNPSSKNFTTETGRASSTSVSFSTEDNVIPQILAVEVEEMKEEHESDGWPEGEIIFSQPLSSRAPTPYAGKETTSHESDTTVSSDNFVGVEKMSLDEDEGMFFMEMEGRLPAARKSESMESDGKGKGNEVTEENSEGFIGRRTRARTMDSPSKAKTPVKPGYGRRGTSLDGSPNNPVIRPTELVTSSPPRLDLSQGRTPQLADTASVKVAQAMSAAELERVTTLTQKHLRTSAQFRQANDDAETLVVNNRRFENHSYEVVAQCMRANHKRRTQRNDVPTTPAPELYAPSKESRSVSPKRKAAEAFDYALPIRSRPLSQPEYGQEYFDAKTLVEDRDRSPKRKAVEIPAGQKVIHMPQSTKFSTRTVGDNDELSDYTKYETNSTFPFQNNRWSETKSPGKSAERDLDDKKENEGLARNRQITQDHLSKLLFKVKEVEGRKTDALQGISDYISRYVAALHDEIIQEIAVRVIDNLDKGFCMKNCGCRTGYSMEVLDRLERLTIASKIRLDQIGVPQIPSEIVQVLKEFPLNSTADWYEGGSTRLHEMCARDSEDEDLEVKASPRKGGKTSDPVCDLASEEQC